MASSKCQFIKKLIRGGSCNNFFVEFRKHVAINMKRKALGREGLRVWVPGTCQEAEH